jgi:hypothetical protein
MEEAEQPDVADGDAVDTVDPVDPGELHTALPPRLESWRKRSAAGAILTGIGLGLREALEPKRDEPSILIVASGDMPTELPVEAELVGFHPSAHVVRIRPWLLEQGDPGAADPGAADPGREATP